MHDTECPYWDQVPITTQTQTLLIERYFLYHGLNYSTADLLFLWPFNFVSLDVPNIQSFDVANASYDILILVYSMCV